MASNKHPGVQQALHDKEKLRTSEQGIVQTDAGYNKLHLWHTSFPKKKKKVSREAVKFSLLFYTKTKLLPARRKQLNHLYMALEGAGRRTQKTNHGGHTIH